MSFNKTKTASNIPMNFQVSAGNYLRTQLRATEAEVQVIKTYMEGQIKAIKDRVALEKKFEGLPLVKMTMCSCKHNCGIGDILGTEVCTGTASTFKNLFPTITKQGVNVGVLWNELVKRGYAFGYKAKGQAVFNKLPKAAQLKLMRLFPKTFKINAAKKITK